MKDVVIREKSTKIIITPKVVEAARRHFNCKDLKGVELEELGLNANSASHWDVRAMSEDLMVSSIFTINSLSEITLAFLEDTGWYKVNYYTGGLFKYGKNKGCSFITEKCIQEGVTKFENEFPITQEGKRLVCMPNRKGRGWASINTIRSSRIPYVFQYFDNANLGGFSWADYCPVSIKAWDNFHYDVYSCGTGDSNLYPKELGDTITADSFCFYSSLVPKDNTLLSNYSSRRPMCHQVACDYDSKIYTVALGDLSINCGMGISKRNVEGYDGEFECAEFNLICNQEIKCSNIIDCIKKESTLKEIQTCPDDTFYSQETEDCVTALNCPTNTFGDESKKRCVEASKCDSSTPYADINSKKCKDSKSCPDSYFFDNITKSCVLPENCSADNPNVDPSTRECTSVCSKDNPYLDPSQNKCVISSECSVPNPIADPSRFLCVTECKEGLINVDNICKTGTGRCPFLSFLYLNDCVKECPEQLETGYYDLECLDCGSENKFYYNYRCVDTCPKYTTKDTQGLPICYDCTSLNLIWNVDRCVEECPEGSLPYSSKLCIKNWKWDQLFQFENMAVDKCPDGYVNDENRVCYPCTSQKKIWEDGKCVDQCSSKTIFANTICLSCEKYNLIKFRDMCVGTCPTKSEKIDESNCKCPDNLKYSEFLFRCVEECTEGMGYFLEDSICVFCDKVSRFLFQGECLKKCPKGIFTNEIHFTCEKIEVIETNPTPTSCMPNPCLNSGECIQVEDDKVSCSCKDNYYGEFCKFTKQDLTRVSEKFSNYFESLISNEIDLILSYFNHNLDVYIDFVSKFTHQMNDQIIDNLSNFISKYLSLIFS